MDAQKKMNYTKEYKDLYMPKTKPSILAVPEMTFIMVDGVGDPNTSKSYKNAIEVLYGLSWGIKMSKMDNTQPDGYFEYVIPPLEGLWWIDGYVFDGQKIANKDNFNWISMIRQPEFVTMEAFERAKKKLLKKSPHLDFSTTRLETYTEGLCCQVMHIGPYDEEPASIEMLEQFIATNGYVNDMSDTRRHHEIYLTDPRKITPKQKTVIRHPIRKVGKVNV